MYNIISEGVLCYDRILPVSYHPIVRLKIVTCHQFPAFDGCALQSAAPFSRVAAVTSNHHAWTWLLWLCVLHTETVRLLLLLLLAVLVV
uniref:Uncharacterized protein n=1 Tax=Anopheles funestus TaxID=62324 RepID=A0A182S1V6_ANOFN